MINNQYWFKITSETTPAPQLFSKTQQTPKDDAQAPLELPLILNSSYFYLLLFYLPFRSTF